MRGKGLAVSAVLALSISAFGPRASATTIEDRAGAALFNLINQHRAADHALPTLTYRQILNTESKRQSDSMAQRRHLDHLGFCDNWTEAGGCGASDGDPTSSRVERIFASDSGINQVCENVAYVFGSKYKTMNRAVKKLYSLWNKSAPHHDCMFDGPDNGPHNIGGIGVTKKGSYWWATFEAAHDTN